MTNPVIAHLNDPSTQLANIPTSPDAAIAHGNDLMSAIGSGSSAGLMSLAESGIAFASSEALKIGGPQYAPIANLAAGVMGGALEGGMVAGPCGAVAGAVAGLIQGIAALGTFEGVTGVGGVSQATEEITRRVNAHAQTYQTFQALPQGWAMSDFCAAAAPPARSRNLRTWQKLLGAAVATDIAWGYEATTISIQQIAAPSTLTFADVPGPNGTPGPEQSLCTPVWWNWATPTNTGIGGLNDCDDDLYFSTPPGSPSSIRAAWVSSAQGLSNSMPPSRVVSLAIARRPDPLFQSVSLYGSVAQGSGPAGGFATYHNPDGINAMATVWGMLGIGSSPLTIVAELSIQAAMLAKDGGVYGPSQPVSIAGKPFRFGNPSMPGGPATVAWSMAQARATLHALIAYYGAMATVLAKRQPWPGPDAWGGIATSPQGPVTHHSMPSPTPIHHGPAPLHHGAPSSAKAAAGRTIQHFLDVYLGR